MKSRVRIALAVFTGCCALRLSAASDIPEVREARALPKAASESRARAGRHNAALRALLASTGMPLGADAESVELRIRALELIDGAITNGVELAGGGGVTADAVAAAAGDFVSRYVLQDDAPLALGRSSRWPAVRSGALASGASCAACGARATTVHHIVPFHVDPSRELDPDNLLPLCDRCHLFVGHLGDFRSWNPDARADAARWLAKLSVRPYALPPVLIVGDSHAANRLPHSTADAWIVADLLGVPASNRLAVSGSTAAQWADDRDGWLTAATNNSAPVVWISLGGNDACAAAADGAVDTAEQLSIAASLVSSVTRLAEGRSLVIATLYADPYQGARPAEAAALDALDAGISNVCALACAAAAAPVVFLDERAVLDASHYDGSGDLHPTAAGYTNLATEIRCLIRNAKTERVKP